MANNKGFLLVVQETAEQPLSIDGFQHVKQYESATLFADDGCRNTLITTDANGISVYLGDRHLHADEQDHTLDPHEWQSTIHTGTLVSFDTQHKQLKIQCDFMGSETVWYAQKGQQFWVSNRLENFSRFGAFEKDWAGVYTFLASAISVAERTPLLGVQQTCPLQTIEFRNGKLNITTSSAWQSNPECNVSSALHQIDQRLHDVLMRSPNAFLMLSAGWDSRVLLSSNRERIVGTYTHGELKSREVEIAYKLGAPLQKGMTFNPLEDTHFGAETALQMLSSLGFALFPHWYHASHYLAQFNDAPLSAGLFVEHLSGHYGINSLSSGTNKLKLLFNSMVRPGVYDKISNEQAISMLTPLLSDAFKTHPWCWRQDVDYQALQKQFSDDTAACLKGYVDSGTNGLQELSERFKLAHAHRQFFVLQTKSAATTLGYHHPYVDSVLAQQVLQLKYRHRVNYKVSQYIVKQQHSDLCSLPMAATLINAGRPILMQEASRLVRIAGEKLISKLKGQTVKGLGWNNFQFLHQQQSFHEYVDLLVDDMWDKPAMHRFIEQYGQANGDAYSMLDMLTKMVTLDFKLHPNAYEAAR
ncbi:hypothetical protein QTP81_03360 [Alteromonas sp. ASW11-36]|uniref:Asparagine synthase n=1 Tax=Alteromonas arenosi TaxID=3055817 RepID=A0ABT7STX8_9ALTE|nr:hypothetical protein [Alteromonas sp. ASW11-36]MDM7859645.1 hypothetical protein [Alteromonas sp. ASW11-36]